MQWYFTTQPFHRGTVVVNRRKWDSDDLRDDLIGEQFFSERPFNKPLVIPGMVPGHQCGPQEWFEFGQPWPYTGPRTVYDADWIPECCPREWPWGPIVGAQVGGLLPADPDAGAAVGGAQVGGLLGPIGPNLGGPTGGAMADGTNRLYCATYGATVTEGTGNFIITAPANTDLVWVAGIPTVGPAQNAWDLRSPHNSAINTPGTWLLRKLINPNARIYLATGWNGRGSKSFQRTTSPFDFVTVSCTS